jgi:hypothetical protein
MLVRICIYIAEEQRLKDSWNSSLIDFVEIGRAIYKNVDILFSDNYTVLNGIYLLLKSGGM